MSKNLFKKSEVPDFSNPLVQQSFLQESLSKIDLIRKEVEINQMAQSLLTQRIRMMQSFVNELPSSDPQYSMLLAQIQMDHLERDELKTRERELVEKIKDKS